MVRVESGAINMSRKGSLALFNYSKDCQFNHLWDQFTMMARGLILDLEDESIVALSFPKFFNASEKEGASVVKFDAPFDALCKYDGSLGIVYNHNGSWYVATRGSFTSDQSRWAEKWLDENVYTSLFLDPNVTYLCEIIYPENRIVINYPFKGLVMLGAYNRVTGVELDYDNDLVPLCERLGMKIAQRHSFSSFVDAQEFVKTLPGDEEGFVIRFRDSGERVKLKGSEYCALHKIISNITALNLWEMLVSGCDMNEKKQQIPEELWDEFDTIYIGLNKKFERVWDELNSLNEQTKNLSDKELGLSLPTLGRYARFLFPLRKKGKSVVNALIYDEIRPTGNKI